MEKASLKYVQLHFGRKVKERRNLLRISQEDLARDAHLHWSYISSVERGQRNISLINIAKLAKALNCHMKEFFPEL